MIDIWIQTISGARVNLPTPKPEQIDIYDIAYALSMKCRFNGQCNQFYSVADHSLRVSSLLPIELALGGLLHDANEAYLPDIPRPVKELVPEYKKVENLTELAIFKKFGINLGLQDMIRIKIADNLMLATEGRDLMGDTTGWGLIEIPLKRTIIPLSAYNSRISFLERFNALMEVKNHVA